jgi:hypothetical protein
MTDLHPYRYTEILLVGDSRFLLDLVTANLAPLPAETILLGSVPGPAPIRCGPGEANAPPLRLVVLALSHSSSEPVVILDQLGLTGIVGTVPLLIISDRPFQAGFERRIFHILFPFSATTLRQVVDAVLDDAAAIPTTQSIPESLPHVLPQRSS